MCGGIESDVGPLDLDQTVDMGSGIYGRIGSTDWKFLTIIFYNLFFCLE